jgi:Domain of unknown function (DUF4395)
MNSSLQCPVSFEQTNENKVRLNAFFIFVLAILLIVTQSKIIAGFMVVDFFARAFKLQNLSALDKLSKKIIQLAKIEIKKIDLAPKRFAAFVGLLFTIVIFICTIYNQPIFANALTIILMAFAALESFFAFCAGCYVYSFFKKIKLIA